MSDLKDQAIQAMNDLIKRLNAYVEETHGNEEIRKAVQESNNYRVQIIHQYMQQSSVPTPETDKNVEDEKPS